MVSLMAWNDILTGLNLVMARDFLEVLFLIRVRANDYEIVVMPKHHRGRAIDRRGPHTHTHTHTHRHTNAYTH